MKPEIAKQLQALLDDRDKRKQADSARVSEQEKAEAKNLADFAAKKDQVIKPAFQEIVDLYQTKGIALRIVEQDEGPNDRGGTQPPSVRLDMSAAYPRTDMQPQFRLTLEKRKRALSLYTATQGQAGPAGEVPLDGVTADWIQTTFLKYASGTLR
jgi:hypothetical protein